MPLEQPLPEKNKAISTKGDTVSMLQLFACKCPRCRRGDMFMEKNPWRLKTTMKMHQLCPVCAQPLDIEPGFYFGAGYVSYALTVAFSAASFIAWWKLIGFSDNENKLLFWIILNALCMLAMQPWFMRVSRTGWLAFFVKYNPHWQTQPPEKVERSNKEQQNNW